MIVATTVGAVLLLVILLSIMVYQMISIKAEENRIAHLKEQIKQYELLIEKGEETIKIRQMEDWIKREAMKLGYSFSKN